MRRINALEVDNKHNRQEGVYVDTVNSLVYVSDKLNNRIKVTNLTGERIREWGTSGSGDDNYNEPHGIYVDVSGSLVYVVDTSNHRVKVTNLTGTFVREWGTVGSGNDN